jgi:hypothetical protein
MTVATVAIRMSLAVLAAGAGVGFGLHAAIQDPVPVATEPQTPSRPDASVSDVAPAQTGQPEPTTPVTEPAEPADNAQTTADATQAGANDATEPYDDRGATVPFELTAADINPLTGTAVITPTELTPLPGAGNASGVYGVAVVGVPGAPVASYYAASISDGPGVASKTLSYKPAPCASARPASGGWYCLNGTWMPTAPGARIVTPYDTQWTTPGPGMPAYAPVSAPTRPALDPVITSYGCAGISPGPSYTCLNGAWVIR